MATPRTPIDFSVTVAVRKCDACKRHVLYLEGKPLSEHCSGKHFRHVLSWRVPVSAIADVLTPEIGYDGQGRPVR